MIKKIVFFLFVAFNIHAQSLFDKDKRWILIDNKIERKEIILQTYDSLLINYNTLILQFLPDGKMMYDYESNAEACAGVNFLDIDTDSTSWHYDSTNQLFTLTFKGGYATLDGFAFKREYKIEKYGEKAFILVKNKEYYFKDLEKMALEAEKLEKNIRYSKPKDE
jgi:hypothetical protein